MTKHRPDCGCSQHREPEPVTGQLEPVTLGREYHPTVPRQMGWDVRGLVDALWRERAGQWMTDPETGIRVSFLGTVKSEVSGGRSALRGPIANPSSIATNVCGCRICSGTVKSD